MMTGWGGDRKGGIKKEEYIKQIMQMSGAMNRGVLNRLSKQELIQIKNLIEGAIYKAIDEYKKNLNLMI